MVDRLCSYPLGHTSRDWYTPCPRMKFEFANVLLLLLLLIIILILILIIIIIIMLYY